ncbi:MAG: hypothetical protein ACLFTL_07555, partial [Alphaproteobacteria bacterium]
MAAVVDPGRPSFRLVFLGSAAVRSGVLADTHGAGARRLRLPRRPAGAHRRGGRGPADAGVRGMSARRSNAGSMAIPLGITVADPTPALAALLLIVVDDRITSPLAIAVLQGAASSRALGGRATSPRWRGSPRRRSPSPA